MIEIDINPNFEAKLLRLKRDETLADLIYSCNESIRSRLRFVPDTSSEEISALEGMLTSFLCTYSSLTEELAERRIFYRELPAEKQFKLMRIYSLYTASKAVLNNLNDEQVEQLRIPDNDNSMLTYSDIDKNSDFSLFTNILPKLKSVGNASNMPMLKYSYFSLFDSLRHICKSYINSNCSSETKKELNRLKIYKTGLDFRELPDPQKKEFSNGNGNGKLKSPSEDIEKLPSILHSYEPGRRASLEKVVGNEEAVKILHSAIIRVLAYDPQKKSNPFSTNGYKFQDAFMLHGEPGVGKNFTVDSLLNYLAKTARDYKEEIEFVDLSAGVKSMYRDRSAQIFERYISLESEGNRIYLNIIDEADGVFTLNERGEMCEESKKLLREMKKAINNNDKGNALYIFMTNYAEAFEAALKQRFKPLYLAGPTTPAHFRRILEQELGHAARSLADSEKNGLGEFFYSTKKELGSFQRPIPFTGRNIRQIALPFVSGDDSILIANEDAIRKSSYDQKLQLIPKIAAKASYSQIVEVAKKHIGELKESYEPSTARYNCSHLR